MSSEVASTHPNGLKPAVDGVRRAALRLAFGVTGCFVLIEALDWQVTFLAPLLAATILVKLQRPPSLAQGLAFVVIIAAANAVVLVLTTALISNPVALILALTLLLYLSFYAHRRGAPDLVTLLLQIAAVSLPTLAVVKPETAATFAEALVLAGGAAVITAWVSYAAFPALPSIGDSATPAASPAPSIEPKIAARHAFLDTLVLFPVLTWYILDATQVAVVVLIMILTLLRLHDPKQGKRAALGLILGNLIGGIAAAVVYNLVLLNHTLLFFAVACLAASLFFAGRIATTGERAPLYALAFTTFILLLGLGLSPLPGGSGEAFGSRLLNVLFALAYAIGALSILRVWRKNPHVL